MTDSWWEGGNWIHFCKWANFEFTLGPLRKECGYTHTGVCDAKIPAAGKTKEKLPDSSWNLKPKPKQDTLF